MPMDYYVKQKPKLLRKHKETAASARPVLMVRYSAIFAEQVIVETRAVFEELIPEIPYIGGKQNNFTDLMVTMTAVLALYRVLKRHGKPLEEIGEITLQTAEFRINKFPAWLPRLGGRLFMSRFWRRRTTKRALISQQRRYPGDFVYEIVPGDGQNYEWGVNYLECAVTKYFAQQNAAEFTPHVCEVDFLMFPAMGIELKRTGTIGQGCTHCDFRFQRN
ncbi:MAG: L-2-amino-thiazoline-4-carboxylic acid hydrolase [Chloroflexi bacterium]|nr:L-2-amino-thiazoline-4-carboxylic acid hydrolase [Chloroflexota bacterium]